LCSYKLDANNKPPSFSFQLDWKRMIMSFGAPSMVELRTCSMYVISEYQSSNMLCCVLFAFVVRRSS
jgi:hypothetical protein